MLDIIKELMYYKINAGRTPVHIHLSRLAYRALVESTYIQKWDNGNEFIVVSGHRLLVKTEHTFRSDEFYISIYSVGG